MDEKIISGESTKEEIANYFFNNFRVSEEAKNNLIKEDITGDILFEIQDKDFKYLGLKIGQIKNLKKFLNENKEKFKEKAIKESINPNYKEEEIKLFFKKNLNYNKNLNNLDGKALFGLSEEGMKELGLNLGQRKILSKYIKYFKTINENISKEKNKIVLNKNSTAEEVEKYLKEILNFSKESIEELACDGEGLFSLEEQDIEDSDLKEEEKEKLKKYLGMNNSNNKIKNKSNIKEKYNISKEVKNFKNIENEQDNNNKFKEPINNTKERKIGKQSQMKLFYKLSNYKIEPIYTKSKYNVFFPLIFQENYFSNGSLSIYEDNSGLINDSYINYEYLFINEKKVSIDQKENFIILLVQVPIRKEIRYLSINLIINKQNRNLENNCYIEIKKNEDNYFYVNNLVYIENNIKIPNIPADLLYEFFLENFFDKTKNINLTYKLSLIKDIIYRISTEKNIIEINLNNLLELLKFCLTFDLKLKNIRLFEIKKINGKYDIKKDYFFSNDNLLKLVSSKKDYNSLFNLIVRLYSIYNKDYLMKLIEDNWKECSRELFNLINNDILRLKDLNLENDELNKIQKYLLLVSKSKDEINYVIKISGGLYKSLKFIKDNCIIICKILEENAKLLYSQSTNYLLTLPKSLDEDNIDNIYNLLKSIYSLIKDKNYKIIDLEEIFDCLVNSYSNRNLKDFCKLHNIVGMLKSQGINSPIIEKFYKKIHIKGINLIIQKKLDTEEIIYFIICQDPYYYNPYYKNDINRDPNIFNYIPITNSDENYLRYIYLIKENQLWKIFYESDINIKIKFYIILLNQMKKLEDINSIFMIFPIKFIDKDFTLLLNEKIGKIKNTILEKKDKDYDLYFYIFDNCLFCNDNNNLDLNVVVDLLTINYDITSKYYFYLLKNEEMKSIVMKIIVIIFKFFLLKNKEDKANAEVLISLLLLSHNKRLDLYFLNQLDKRILTEEDFYEKEENSNFILFKLFFEKCDKLIKNVEISEGKYLLGSILIKNKILTDLKENRIKYSIINKLIDEDNLFYRKVLVITDEEEIAKTIYEQLKENLKICREKIKKLESIEIFYRYFYNNSKKEIINN